MTNDFDSFQICIHEKNSVVNKMLHFQREIQREREKERKEREKREREREINTHPLQR